MRYLLDANTYIQAKNQYYGMDICPAYWDWLDQQFQQGVVASVNMIGRELRDGKGELAEWARERPEHLITNDDEETQAVHPSTPAGAAAPTFVPLEQTVADAAKRWLPCGYKPIPCILWVYGSAKLGSYVQTRCDQGAMRAGHSKMCKISPGN
ncbi:DUF4411 family protein [Marinobacter gelidimuriae]|uniref:DUF4411 family protein n=1 Tax=Marinobacter gelidimuriae TaxID=2739064 RepID=UPI00037A94AD|nr:DUF4411 family protein [Marinobacter gelidimuriae]